MQNQPDQFFYILEAGAIAAIVSAILLLFLLIYLGVTLPYLRKIALEIKKLNGKS